MSSFTRVEAFGAQLEEAERLYYMGRDSSKRQDKFYASGVMDCGRKQINDILTSGDEKGEVNIKYRRDAYLGEVIHEMLQAWAVASGRVKRIPAFTRDHTPLPTELVGTEMDAIEVPVNRFTIPRDRLKVWSEHKLGGKCDGILTTAAGLDYIWEIKTIDNKYLSNPNYEKWFLEKMYHYEAQVQWYMWAFDIPQGLITVIDRNKFMERFQNIIEWPFEEVCREYVVTYDEALMENELARVANMVTYLDEKRLPGGEPGRGPCRFCSEVTCQFNPIWKGEA